MRSPRAWNGAGSPPLGASMCLVQRVPVQSKKIQLFAPVDTPEHRGFGTLPVWSPIERQDQKDELLSLTIDWSVSALGREMHVTPIWDFKDQLVQRVLSCVDLPFPAWLSRSFQHPPSLMPILSNHGHLRGVQLSLLV